MRLAVVGAGRWGQNLIENFFKLGVLKVVVESDAAKVQDLKAKYPEVHFTGDLDAALGAEVQAVAIATPAVTHFEIAKLCLAAKKDVFVEKPMTLNSREARDLVDLASSLKLILMTGHLLLYQPAIQWIKEQLDKKTFGAVYSLHQERLNLGQARNVENVLWNLGVHDLAVILYLMGEKPLKVVSSGQAVLQKDIEDDFYLHMNFSRGAQAHLHNSWLWPQKLRQMTVICEGGMLVYDELKQIVTFHKKTIGKTDLKNVDGGSEVVFNGTAEPLKLELEHFLNSVKTRTEPFSSGASALSVIEILEKCHVSKGS